MTLAKATSAKALAKKKACSEEEGADEDDTEVDLAAKKAKVIARTPLPGPPSLAQALLLFCFGLIS